MNKCLIALLLLPSIFGYDLVGEYDGKEFYSEKEHMSWDSSWTFCSQEGWVLAAMDSENEYLFLMDALRDYDSNSRVFFWSSATVASSSYVWRNGSGTNVDTNTYPVEEDVRLALAFNAPLGIMQSYVSDAPSENIFYPLCQNRI